MVPDFILHNLRSRRIKLSKKEMSQKEAEEFVRKNLVLAGDNIADFLIRKVEKVKK